MDDDLAWDCEELPPGKPNTQPTEMSYTIAKSRLMSAFGEIVYQANSVHAPTLGELTSLDNMLDAAYDLVPSFLRVRPMSECFQDTPELIMQRFNIALLRNKSRCVLHRQYLLSEDQSSKEVHLNDKCVVAAMELLEHQSVIYEALQTGGALDQNQWYIHSLSSHDFLLGAMIVYLSLTFDKRGTPTTKPSSKHLVLDAKIRGVMFAALEKSYFVWIRTVSKDAKKFSEVLGGMLVKLNPDYVRLDSHNREIDYTSSDQGRLLLLSLYSNLSY